MASSDKQAVAQGEVPDRNVAADLRFIVAVRAVVLGIAADLGERAKSQCADSEPVFDRRGYAARSVSPAPQLELEKPSAEKA